jgi:REP element-mobilizing transposase RayT
MKFQPHRRRSIRLKEYDYSQAGAYFVTMCTQNRECLFGEISDGKMELNNAGIMAEQCWNEIPKHYPHVGLDACVIMPNHIHGIIMIENGVVPTNVGANNYSPLHTAHSPLPQPSKQPGTPGQPESPEPSVRPNGTSKTIGAVVRGYKIGVTKWFRENTQIKIVWQRNYYERIIRDDDELNRIRQYIVDNPINWQNDENYFRI